MLCFGRPFGHPRYLLVVHAQTQLACRGGRHAVERIDVFEPGVAKQRQTCCAKDGVKDVDPVARPIGDAAFFELLGREDERDELGPVDPV